MDADESKLKRRVYNLGAMSFTPKSLGESIKKVIPDFKMHYHPDFRQDIADTWPKKLDDSNATIDWGWQPDFDVDSMTEDILAQLRGEGEMGGESKEAL